MTISTATKTQVHLTAGNAGDASGNADRAQWAIDHGDIEVAKQSLEWCVEQANRTAAYARSSLEMLSKEGRAS